MLVLQDDHSSPVLEWMTRAAGRVSRSKPCARPADGDWTAALLAAIERPGAPPVRAGLDLLGALVGRRRDRPRPDRAGAARGRAPRCWSTRPTRAGVLPLDVRALDPDFLVFPTYKWVLGPYGRAFLYVARRHQDGVPLEQTGYGRRAVSAEQHDLLRDTAYVAGARRFDMGERDHFISLEMASIGMEMMAEWGRAVVERAARC